MLDLIALQADELDGPLKIVTPMHEHPRRSASDPCICTHPRELHLELGGCRGSGCGCDLSTNDIPPSAVQKNS